MTNKEFVIWFKGFVDGAHDYNITPKQWDLLKEKINEVEDDYIDESGHFVEPLPHIFSPISATGVITGSISITSGSSTSVYNTGAVWNDKMGCFHYINYPEGFGYYINNTSENKNKENE